MSGAGEPKGDVEVLYRRRTSRRWLDRLHRLLTPPAPLIMNPREPKYPPQGRWNLYVGGAGSHVEGYVNLDIFAMPGVDVAGDVTQLPFASGVFAAVECDAVLEHVTDPAKAMAEIARVTADGGLIHLVTPFCHPFHAYPNDYRRFTVEGLRELARGLEVIHEGWRTGPTATMLVFILEYTKLWLPWRWWRGAVHVGLGWLLFPFRYLDLLFFRSASVGRLGNHCYVWLRKPSTPAAP